MNNMESNIKTLCTDNLSLLGKISRYTSLFHLAFIHSVVIVILLLFMIRHGHAAEWIYTVVEGDNLWDFSEKHLDNVMRFEQLRKLNNVKNPKRMQPGSWLRVPMKWIRSNAVPARLVAIEGQVQLTRSAGTQELALSSNTQVFLGDTLKTGPKSSAAILFADGTALTPAQSWRNAIRSSECAWQDRLPAAFDRGTLANPGPSIRWTGFAIRDPDSVSNQCCTWYRLPRCSDNERTRLQYRGSGRRGSCDGC